MDSGTDFRNASGQIDLRFDGEQGAYSEFPVFESPLREFLRVYGVYSGFTSAEWFHYDESGAVRLVGYRNGRLGVL